MTRRPYLPLIGPAGRAFQRRDFAWLAGWLTARFGVPVAADRVAGWQPDPRWVGLIEDSWSDGSWACWWKNRMEAAGLFGPKCAGVEAVRLEVPMHVFFLAIDETDEQLARLRRKEPGEKDSGPRLATPGIERVVTMPAPIDRTAAAVVG